MKKRKFLFGKIYLKNRNFFQRNLLKINKFFLKKIMRIIKIKKIFKKKLNNFFYFHI